MFVHFRIKVSTKPAFPKDERNNTDWVNSGERGGYSQVMDVFREFPTVQWYVLGDDDTLFLPPNLNGLLAPKDPAQDWYIGQTSEIPGQVRRHGALAFGGGGIVLSQKTMFRLQDKFLDFVLRNRHMYGGDERIGRCLIDDLGVKLSFHQGFHQLDLQVYNKHGFDAPYLQWLEASGGVRTMSLHHLEGLAHAMPHNFSTEAMAHAAKNSPATFLRQSACDSKYFGAFAISHGFSVRFWPPTDSTVSREAELLDASKYEANRTPFARYIQAGSQRLYTRRGTSKQLLENSLQLVSKYSVMVPKWREVGGICENGNVIYAYDDEATMHSIQIQHPLPMDAQRLCCTDMKIHCHGDRARLDILMDVCSASNVAK
ncbi:hypothetical protein WJX72_006106 [[Myrmecia] bisecta]|uniref:Fringe n=1 Tax=[Myrmecia] bisecta TaxID=41462 RepID=A0AAW1PCX4_9CHLO